MRYHDINDNDGCDDGDGDDDCDDGHRDGDDHDECGVHSQVDPNWRQAVNLTNSTIHLSLPYNLNLDWNGSSGDDNDGRSQYIAIGGFAYV